MTTTLIDRTKLDAVGRRLKNQIIVIAVVAVVIVAICICLCLAATPKNYVWIIAVNSVLSVGGGWFVIYKLLADVLVLNAHVNLFSRLLAKPSTVVDGMVKSVQKKRYRTQKYCCRCAYACWRLAPILFCRRLLFVRRCIGSIVRC